MVSLNAGASFFLALSLRVPLLIVLLLVEDGLHIAGGVQQLPDVDGPVVVQGATQRRDRVVAHYVGQQQQLALGNFTQRDPVDHGPEYGTCVVWRDMMFFISFHIINLLL